MTTKKLLLVLLYLSGSILISETKDQKRENEMLGRIFQTYENRYMPTNNESNPIEVKVNIYIRSIEQINSLKEEMEVQITYREVWNDPRLKFSHLLQEKEKDEFEFFLLTDPRIIWTPDIFFTNEKTGRTHDILKRNTFARIYPEGEILFSTRISLILSCPMNFKHFPFDTQICPMKLASYAHTKEDIRINWKDEDPIQMSPILKFNEFSFEGHVVETCDSVTITGIYGCIRADFEFKRKSSRYFIDVFIPCAMLIIVTYLSFWIHPSRNATARVLITLVPLLTMAVMVQRFNDGFPVTSYTKAIDNYTGLSLTFCFVSLIVFVMTYYMAGNENSSGENGVVRVVKSCKMNCNWENVDGVMRCLYPALFIIFIIVYFSISY